MPLGVDCPACSHPFMIPDKMAGRPVKCPRCEHPFTATPSVAAGVPAEPRMPLLPPQAAVPLAEVVAPPVVVPIARVVTPTPTTLPVAQLIEPAPAPPAPETADALPAPAPLPEVPPAAPASLVVQPLPHAIRRQPTVTPPAPAPPRRRGLTRLVMDLPDTVMRNVPKPVRGIVGLAAVALLAGLGAWAVLFLAQLQIVVLALAALGLVFGGVALVALVQRSERGVGLPLAAVLVNVQALVLAFVGPAGSQPVETGTNPKPAPATPITELLPQLKSSDADERMKAAYKVRDVARDLNQAVETLMTLLRDSQPKVRVAAAEALGQIGVQARIAYPYLADVNRGDEAEHVRTKAKEAMERIGPPTLSDAPQLLDRLKDRKNGRHPRAAAALALAVARSDDRTTLKALEDALKDTDALVRVSAARALWSLGVRQADILNEALIAGLKDPDPVVKQQAAEALFALGPEARPAAPQLEAVLGDPDALVRLRATQALWSIGPAAKAQVPRLLKGLEDRDAKVRVYSAMAVWTIAHVKDGVPVLADALRNPDVLVRQMAVKMLYTVSKEARASQIAVAKAAGKVQIVDAVPALTEALKDGDSDVRGIAAMTLNVLGKDARSALPALMQALKYKNDPIFRAEAAHAIGAVGQDLPADSTREAVLTALGTALADPDNTVRVFAAQSLWVIERNADRVVPTLLKVLLEDPDRDVRAKAAFALGVLEGKAKAAVPTLNAALKDTNPLLRLAAATALGKIGTPARVCYPTLDQLAKEDKQPEVRKAASEAIKKIGPPTRTDVQTLLIPALKNPNPDYRAAAAVCLWMLFREARDAVLPLSEALADTDEQVRSHAAFALAAIGPDAEEAVPALVRALQNQNDDLLRMRAAYALGEIGAKAKKAVLALRQALADKRPTVRLTTAQALWTIEQQPQDVLAALTSLLEDQELEVPMLLSDVETLKEVGPKCTGDAKLIDLLRKRTVPALVKASGAEDKSLQLEATAALGEIGVEGRVAVPRMLELLMENDTRLRLAAIEALMRIADAEKAAKVGMRTKTAFAVLLFNSKVEPNEQVRKLAGVAMTRIGQPGAADVPELLAIGGDKSESLAFRSAAIQVLGLIGPEAKAHVDAMCKLLSSDEPAVRALIASALRELGPDGKAAIGPLIATLKDQDPYVRVAVLQALGDIGQFHPALCEKAVREVFLNNNEDPAVHAAAEEALKKVAPK
jgi:predicted Zn finger-like uncharacterized protein